MDDDDDAEIELPRCDYPARCSLAGCRHRATTIVRYVDRQGRALRQLRGSPAIDARGHRTR
jgi:hypothetical protein